MNHLSTTSLNPNIITGNAPPLQQVQIPAQQITPISEAAETLESPVTVPENSFPSISQTPQVGESQSVTDDPNNFPSLSDKDPFPSLSYASAAGPSRGKGKKGRGRNKGQPLLTLGVQRMSIN